ncbi:MAG: bifunctional pyr operon transcriptional regulator/uracil phosphoribosyltransferase PyrR [Clostridia bacterium]
MCIENEKTVILDEKGMDRAIARISYEIIERNKGAENLCIIGVLTRGRYLGERIAAKIKDVEKCDVKCGYIDITKDLTSINFSVEGENVVLVDDVIYTGRSVRAALDGILKSGRPSSIKLAVLVDRGHRELPIRADFVGKNLPTAKDEIVKVLLKETDDINKIVII